MHDLGVLTRLLLGAADKVVNSRGSYAKPRRMNRPAKFAGLQRARGSLNCQAKLVKLAEGYIEGISPHFAPRYRARNACA